MDILIKRYAFIGKRNWSLLLYFLCLTSMSAQDWKVFGSGGEGFFFHMIDSTSYLVEFNGHIRKYEDETFKTVYVNSGGPFDGVTAITDDGHGSIYVVADIFRSDTSRLLKSTDQGETWEEKWIPKIPDANLVYFVNKDVGFIAGKDAKLIRTEDGGLTWKKVYESDDIITSMTFISDLEGFVVGGNGVNDISLKTTDGGKTWNQWTDCGYDCNMVFFSSSCFGYITSLTNVKKYDAHTNTSVWLDVPDGLGYGPIYFINDHIGYLAIWKNTVGSPGFYPECDIYMTDDGGSTWTIQTAPHVLAVPDVFCKVDNTLYTNCGNYSNETPDRIMVTTLPSHTTFTCSDSIVHPSCHGQSDGEIFLKMTGGLPPFHISWTPSTLSGDHAEGLSGGTYEVTIHDSSGLCARRRITLQDPSAIQVYAEVKNTNMPLANGSLTIHVEGGMSPFSYQWSHSDTLAASFASGLAAGYYHVTVTDAKGCKSILRTQVNHINPIAGKQEYAIATNPASPGNVIIRSGSAFTAYSVYNVTGQKIISGSTGNDLEFSFDLGHNPPGIYFIRLETGTGQFWSSTFFIP